MALLRAPENRRSEPQIAAPRARRPVAVAAALLASLAVAIVASVLLGSRMLSPGDALAAILDPSAEAGAIVWGLRIPRTVLGILCGAAFAVAGALIQAVSRNPLAEPGIVGVSAGAGFGVTVAAAAFGLTSPSATVGFAFAGALAATVIVLAIGTRARADAAARMLLAGAALTALLGGLSTWISLLDSTTFTAVRNWALGSIVTTGLEDARGIAPLLAIGLVLAFACAPGLNALALGEDLATTLGSNPAATRALGVVAITLLAGGATALTGGIAFVGLMVPHLMRWIVGPDQRRIIAASLLAGPALVLAADVVGRLVAAPGEIQVGVVTAVLGAPVLIAMVRRREVIGL